MQGRHWAPVLSMGVKSHGAALVELKAALGRPTLIEDECLVLRKEGYHGNKHVCACVRAYARV